MRRDVYKRQDYYYVNEEEERVYHQMDNDDSDEKSGWLGMEIIAVSYTHLKKILRSLTLYRYVILYRFLFICIIRAMKRIKNCPNVWQMLSIKALWEELWRH